jgi:aerobic carbon-monoxide dehydrogenase small subunit
VTDEPVRVSFTVNGSPYDLRLPARRLLSDALRHDLRLTGTHVGCEHGVCGACTVLVDGQPMRSCLLFAVSLDGAAITTVEGCRSDDGGMGPVQQAFQDCHALQCGFCTPGFITTVTAYLSENPSPTEAEAREAIAGNLCRCTGYQNIVAAVLRGAELLSAPGPTPPEAPFRASGPTPSEDPGRASGPAPSEDPGPAAAPGPSGASRLPPGPTTGAATRPGSSADVSSGDPLVGSPGVDSSGLPDGFGAPASAERPAAATQAKGGA